MIPAKAPTRQWWGLGPKLSGSRTQAPGSLPCVLALSLYRKSVLHRFKARAVSETLSALSPGKGMVSLRPQ